MAIDKARGKYKELAAAEEYQNFLILLAGKISKIVTEDDAKAKKDAAAAGEKAAAAELRRLEALNRFNQELDKEIVRYEKLWQTISKQDAAKQLKLEQEADTALGLHSKHVGEAVGLFTQLGDAQWKLTDAEKNALPWITLENDKLAQMAQRSKEIMEEIQNRDLPARRKIELEYQRQIDASKRYIAQLALEVQAGKASADKLEAAKKQEADTEIVFNEQRIASLKAFQREQERATMMQGVSLLQTLGFRRAAAIVEAIWETARSIQAFANLDFYGGTMHALAAAEYAVVAGQSGGGLSAGGGAAATAPSSAGTMPVSGPAMAPGAIAGYQHNIVVKIESDIPYTIKAINHEVIHNDANLIARQSRVQTPYGGR